MQILAEFGKREKSKERETDKERVDNLDVITQDDAAAEDSPQIITEEEEIEINPASSPKDDMNDQMRPLLEGPSVEENQDEIIFDEQKTDDEIEPASEPEAASSSSGPQYLGSSKDDISKNVKAIPSSKIHPVGVEILDENQQVVQQNEDEVGDEVRCTSEPEAAKSSPGASKPKKPKKQSRDVAGLFDTLHGGLLKGKYRYVCLGLRTLMHACASRSSF